MYIATLPEDKAEARAEIVDFTQGFMQKENARYYYVKALEDAQELTHEITRDPQCLHLHTLFVDQDLYLYNYAEEVAQGVHNAWNQLLKTICSIKGVKVHATLMDYWEQPKRGRNPKPGRIAALYVIYSVA